VEQEGGEEEGPGEPYRPHRYRCYKECPGGGDGGDDGGGRAVIMPRENRAGGPGKRRLGKERERADSVEPSGKVLVKRPSGVRRAHAQLSGL